MALGAVGLGFEMEEFGANVDVLLAIFPDGRKHEPASRGSKRRDYVEGRRIRSVPGASSQILLRELLAVAVRIAVMRRNR